MAILSLILSTTAVYAQQERIELPRTDMGVRDVMKTIQQQSHYIFAYDERVFDVIRTVHSPSTVASVGELLELITEGAGCSWVISGSYIVIHVSPGESSGPARTSAADPRTNDKYRQSGLSVDYDVRPQQSSETSTAPQPVVYVPVMPPVDLSGSFSDWHDPDTYSPIRNALPRGAIKTDLLYGAATLTPNIGFEVGLDARSTIELTWGWNQWNHEGRRRDNKKLNHGLARAEYRRWFCERFDGHYLGANVFGAKYNVGGYDVPNLFERKFRYEGWAIGAGVNYGYHLALTPRLGVDFHVGVGVMRYDHTRFECVRCGTEIDRPSGVWFGPTRAGIDLVFMLWK